MVSLPPARYAVFATGRGGVVLEDRRFAERIDADRAQRELARTCSGAHRVLVIDRLSGAVLADMQGPSADTA